MRKRLAIAAAAMLLLVCLTLAAFESWTRTGHFKDAFARFIGARLHHPVRIDGALELHLFAANPRIVIMRLVIFNPAWMPAGELGTIGSLAVDFEWPAFTIRQLEVGGAQLRLIRNSAGRANWGFSDSIRGGSGPPLMKSIAVNDAKVFLADTRRHLEFRGQVSVRGAVRAERLQVQARGWMNGRSVSIDIEGDPLSSAGADRPYAFTFAERSNDSRLIGRGTLSHPFDLRELDAHFDAAGPNLRDLYFMTGLTLPNSAEFRLSGDLQRRDAHFAYRALAVASGQSDLSGSITVDTSDAKPRITYDLHSHRFLLADIGKRENASHAWIFPDTSIRFAGMRRIAAAIHFEASEFIVARQSLQSLRAIGEIADGVLTLREVSAHILQGAMNARVSVDANQENARSTARIDLTGVRAGTLDRGHDPPRFEGKMRAQLNLTGDGNSMHAFVSSANGRLIVVMPEGSVRESIAEFAALHIAKGIKLRLTGDHDVAVRCAVAEFNLQNGTLNAQRLFVQTDSAIIIGAGRIDLAAEKYDLQFRERVRSGFELNKRAGFAVGGPLRKPSLSLVAKSFVSTETLHASPAVIAQSSECR